MLDPEPEVVVATSTAGWVAGLRVSNAFARGRGGPVIALQERCLVYLETALLSDTTNI
jgi:hypothetical protein